MTDSQMDSALEVAIRHVTGVLRKEEHFPDWAAVRLAEAAVSVLGLSVQRQSMPKRLAWAQRTDRPGWYWREDERVECTRLVTPWRETEGGSDGNTS